MEIEKRKKSAGTAILEERSRSLIRIKLEMEHAARGGEVGRKKLLERLGIREDKRAPVQRGQDQNRKERDKADDQRTPVLRGRDQKRKEREKTEVREQNAAARMSSPTTKEGRPAYLAMWMKEDDETRYFWEGRQPDQEADIARLAREMQKTDQQLGQGLQRNV